MTRSELKNFLLENFEKVNGMIRQKLYFKYNNVFNEIFNHTSYLPNNSSFVERLYQIINDLYNRPLCNYCKNNKVKFNGITYGYSEFCSYKCMANSDKVKKKKENTNFERYGVSSYFQTDEFWDNYEETCLKRYGEKSHNKSEKIKNKKVNSYLHNYGVNNPSKVNEVKEKKKNSCQKNFGVSIPLQNEDVKNKVKNTNLNRYNVDNPLKVDKFKEKFKNTNLEKFGETNYCKTEEFKNRRRQEFFNKYFTKLLEKRNLTFEDDEFISLDYYHNWKCSYCDNIFQAKYNSLRDGFLCPYCYPRIHSKFELDIKEEIEKYYNNEIVLNTRNIINPYEIDIFFPKDKLAIEFNGLYWHSNIDSKYHLMKTNLCEEKGIRLIYIFEDEWINSREIVINKLKSLLNLNHDKEKIYARNCYIQEIDSKTKNEFLDQFHLQGKDSSNIKLGAFYNNQLISVMTFSKSNISRGFKQKDGYWELNRFCIDYNYHVPGIAGKLLEYFKRNYNWIRIFTYADKRWSQGNLYKQLGFIHEHDSKPNYWYIRDMERIHRFNLRKTENDPKDIPEWILRQSEGYQMVWDCGHMKFSLYKQE